MKNLRLLVTVLVVIIPVLLLEGCAKPPETEKQAAKAAMDATVLAGGDKYAVTDMEAAKQIWDTAESQMKDKKYKEAKQSYIDAKAAFEKTAEAVESEKKVVADQANTALKTVEASWENLQGTAKKVESKLKEKKEAWIADANTIREGLEQAKEMIVTDSADAKIKLDELSVLVNKWENAFEEIASTPTQEYHSTGQGHYSTLTGIAVGIHRGVRKGLVVKSDRDKATVNFRMGRNTVYIPQRYPYIGERVKVEFLTNRGVNVAYKITILN